MEIMTLDLGFGGLPQTIAAFLVRGPQGAVLVETGPGSTLPILLSRLAEAGIAVADVKAVFVTHIHLDHAGAAGWWTNQGVTVYVHPNGADHLVDPSKLLRSASRIYGDRMDELWGETQAAAPNRVVPIADGSVIEIAGLSLRAVETPGHANHHHIYRLGDIAFVGDALGIRLGSEAWIDLPAPPPEFDLTLWEETLGLLRREGLSAIYRTHFDVSAEVDAQIDQFAELLEEAASAVRGFVEQGLDRSVMVDRFTRLMRRHASTYGITGETAAAYELANPRAMSVDGIARYWRKRSDTEPLSSGLSARLARQAVDQDGGT